MDIFNYIDKEIINNKDKSFNQLYLFTNENVDAYKGYFNLNNKSLLTVGSSLDQAINAALDGCEDIAVCDICPLTKYYYYLKLASILTLSKEDFLLFLCPIDDYDNYNRKFLTHKTFNKVKDTLKVLDYDSYYVWNYLINKYSKTQIRKLFRSDISYLESIIKCNTYLFDNYYERIGTILQNININFINNDITTYQFNRKYDNIWLSNVAQYTNYDERNNLLNNCYNSMHKDSLALLCYFWNTTMTIKGLPLFEPNEIDAYKIEISSAYVDSIADSILVYKMK